MSLLISSFSLHNQTTSGVYTGSGVIRLPDPARLGQFAYILWTVLFFLWSLISKHEIIAPGTFLQSSPLFCSRVVLDALLYTSGLIVWPTLFRQRCFSLATEQMRLFLTYAWLQGAGIQLAVAFFVLPFLTSCIVYSFTEPRDLVLVRIPVFAL